jgi:hypothetical protein
MTHDEAIKVRSLVNRLMSGVKMDRIRIEICGTASVVSGGYSILITDGKKIAVFVYDPNTTRRILNNILKYVFPNE